MENNKKTGNLDNFDIDVNDDMLNNLLNPDSPEDFKYPVNKSVLDHNEAIQKDASTIRKEERKRRKEHKKRNKIKSIKNKRVFNVVWISMVICLGLTLGSYLVTGTNDLFAVGRATSTVEITINEEMTPSTLADLLYENGVINSPEFFQLYCLVTADVSYINTGVYDIDTDMDYEAILNFLQKEQSAQTVTLYFTEGITVLELSNFLEINGVCSAEEFLAECESGDYDNYDMISLIENEDERYYTLEGYLFPATYEFYLNENVSSVVGKFLYAFQKNFTSEMLEMVDNSGYTLDEIIILASIIQQEAASVEDMYNVSAVLHNRLESGSSVGIYTLGLDSTYFYPYSASTAPDGFVSDYNTYADAGLPAGAIGNPGVDAIMAALNPNEEYSDMYYFLHAADGTAYYAETYAEHLSNLEKAGY